jgi:division/cell wall cluster transcriptional repressor MraZ
MLEDAAIVPYFHGSFVYGVDAGRRVMFPSVWRPKNRNVEFTAIAHPIGVESCLLVLPPAGWEAIMQKLANKNVPKSDHENAQFVRKLAERSVKLKLDKAWRFTLPAYLADAVGISNEAQFVGLLHEFEIWSPERYRSVPPVDDQKIRARATEVGL